MYCNKFLILGGDQRNVALAQHLQADGKKVLCYGFSTVKNPTLQFANSLAEGIQNTEVIIGPTPCCVDQTNLNLPFNERPISAEEVFSEMHREQIFMAGYIRIDVLAMAEEKGIRLFDILKRNEMAIMNAIPTAEGAIQIAMEEMPITLHGSHAMVLGFGRIGKILCHMLKGLGANVYAVCRKHEDVASIRSFGYTPLYTHQLNDSLGKMDVIFNTVPSMLLDKNNLRYVSRQCLLVELASKPFGIDFEASKNEGLKVMWASSLPGKVAPVTAALYIKETVYNIIQEVVV